MMIYRIPATTVGGIRDNTEYGQVKNVSRQEQNLELVADICEELLKNGAEIFRVQESAIRMLKAFEIQKSNVYIISNGIFLSAKDEEGNSLSEVRHVPLGSTHLERVAELNQLCRDICYQGCPYEESVLRLTQIKKIPSNSFPIEFAFSLLGIAAFTYLFKGTLYDVCFATLIGIAEEFFLYLSSRYGSLVRLVRVVLASCVIALLANFIVHLGIPVQQNIMIIGAIMPLLPGVAFTTSIREFYNGDYLSGTIHLLDTLVTTLCIAVGIYIPFAMIGRMGGLL